MRLKTVRLVVMLALVLLTAPLAAHAQPATKVYRIGIVRNGTASVGVSEYEAFTQRLRELGYTAGQNLVIEWRFADGRIAERVPALVAELVQLQVDCLVVAGIGPIRIAKQATSTIPVVMTNASDDPVRLGPISLLPLRPRNVSVPSYRPMQKGAARSVCTSEGQARVRGSPRQPKKRSAVYRESE